MEEICGRTDSSPRSIASHGNFRNFRTWIQWGGERSPPLIYWTTLGFSAGLCLATLLLAFGAVPPIGWYQRAIGARILVFSLIALTYFAQCVAWYFADWRRLQNHPARRFRRNLKLLLVSFPLIAVVVIPLHRYLLRPPAPAVLAGPNESIQLDGVDDVLTIEDVGFEDRRPFTLEAWIRPDKPQRGTVASYGPVSLNVMAAGEGNRFRIQVSRSETEVLMLDAEETVATNRWTHLALTYDANALVLFVNGRRQAISVLLYDAATDQVLTGTSLPVPLEIPSLWAGTNFLVGNMKPSNYEPRFPFSGRIGEVRLTRSVFYQEQFNPEPNLTVSPDTTLLLHLSDDTYPQIDATGRREVMLFR